MKGFYNRILRIDATKKDYRVESVGDEILEKNLGGKGLATYLLSGNNIPGVEPLSSDNHLILAIGPVTGTSIWGSCRYGIFTKSPQTNFYAESKRK